MCELLTSFFSEKGYDVDTVQDGEHALARLEERDYALVITDIKLPGMSGLELLASIRVDWPEVAVIIMTAFQLYFFCRRSHEARRRRLYR